MDTDLDTLATALYVSTDDLLKDHPQIAPERPRVGFDLGITDAEMLTLAVMQAHLGFTSENRWIRYAHTHMAEQFPSLPQQPGYNKRLRKLTETMAWLITVLRQATPIAEDDVWVIDSTPVECARSREAVHRSELAGYAEYGNCASHSRFFWGLRLHLVCTLHGMPVGWALTGTKADERQTLLSILSDTAGPNSGHRQLVIADKNYFGAQFEAELQAVGIDLLRPARTGEAERAGARFFKPLRQVVESINDTLKDQLDLERHGGRTVAGVCARITQRLLALTAAIWHNDTIGATVRRSLTAYDH